MRASNTLLGGTWACKLAAGWWEEDLENWPHHPSKCRPALALFTAGPPPLSRSSRTLTQNAHATAHASWLHHIVAFEGVSDRTACIVAAHHRIIVTGDSITVAPSQTLTDKELQRLRDASIAIIREMGVECGGSNVQMSINPEDGESREQRGCCMRFGCA